MRRKLRKGSKEARAFMAKIRGMRGKKHRKHPRASARVRRLNARRAAGKATLKNYVAAKKRRKSRLVRGKKNPRRLTHKHGGGWAVKRRKVARKKAARVSREHLISFKPHKGGKRFYFAMDEAKGSFLTTSKPAAKRFITEEMALKVAKNVAKSPAIKGKFRSILVT